MEPLALSLGLVPVALFLLALLLMDSYKLVPRRALLASLGVGVLVALISLALHRAAVEVLHVGPLALRRYLAPLVEETLKAAYLLWLIRRARVGFMVDAAIHGFAIGTGFALAENLYYTLALGSTHPLLWVVRGLGTAVMHGSTTAVVGILGKGLGDRHRSRSPVWMLPGLLLALVAHAFFNHLVLDPLVMTALLLVTMPLLLLAVFERSERATRAWLGTGLDADLSTLGTLIEGGLPDTPVGRYLESLKSHFAPAVVADMLCLLRVHLELALSAKGILLARSAGIEIPIDDRVRADLEELRFLERSIGPTGMLALAPFLRIGNRELWQLHLLRR